MFSSHGIWWILDLWQLFILCLYVSVCEAERVSQKWGMTTIAMATRWTWPAFNVILRAKGPCKWVVPSRLPKEHRALARMIAFISCSIFVVTRDKWLRSYISDSDSQVKLSTTADRHFRWLPYLTDGSKLISLRTGHLKPCLSCRWKIFFRRDKGRPRHMNYLWWKWSPNRSAEVINDSLSAISALFVEWNFPPWWFGSHQRLTK